MLGRGQASQEHSFFMPGRVEAMDRADVDCREFESLYKIGIALDGHRVRQMRDGIANFRRENGIRNAMDALQPSVTTASVATPVQFLQNWLPGFVFVITAARKIDDLVGIATIGAWEDEQVVQGVMERVGTSVPYGDYTNIPLSSWNTNFVTRTVVRFEEGMQVGNLEAARSARMMVDDSGMKRESAALALEIIRNTIGFSGYNNGANLTYGFLNDPNLSNYQTVANGASTSPLWSTKTFLEIQRDILTAIVAIRNNSQDTIDPEKVDLTLAVATAAVDYLATPSDFGISVRSWLREAYPRVRVVSAPQLNAANSSANVFYLYADAINDMSTDDGRTWVQPVPAKFLVNGVQQMAKSYEESYTNATAGLMLKRPYAVVRYSGI